MKGATDQLVDGLAALGPPETEAGQQAKSELDSLGTQLQQQLDEVEQETDAGSLSIVTITAALSNASSAVKSTYESLKSIDSDGELRDGFENADTCDSLRDQVDTIGNGVGQLGGTHPYRFARDVGRPRPGRFVGRHDRAARDPRALRRRDRHARLGVDVVQPRARARSSAGRPPRAPQPDPRLRGRHRPLRDGIARVRIRPRRSECSSRPARARVWPAPRSSAVLSPCSQTLRAGCTGRPDLGPRRCNRRSPRPSSGRRSHAAVRLGVDLPRPGARDPARAADVAGSPDRAGLGAGRAAAYRREHRPAARFGRARRRALPARDPPDQRLAPGAAHCRARRHRDAARGESWRCASGTRSLPCGPEPPPV